MTKHNSPHMSDMTRREEFAEREAAIIKRNAMQRRNAKEWTRRANMALLCGNYTLATNLINQAKLELSMIH
jgi:hypothetical protein